MDLLLIFGSGAVGKMTVGQEVMKKTGFRLFHNHVMIEPVLEVFGEFKNDVIERLRNVVFDEFIKTDFPGLIFTFMWAFNYQEDWDYVKTITDRYEASGGSIYYAELMADQAVRLKRNETENRIKNKPSKRDLPQSRMRILNEGKYRLVSLPGEIPFEHYIKIDNTDLSPEETADRIIEAFHLPLAEQPEDTEKA